MGKTSKAKFVIVVVVMLTLIVGMVGPAIFSSRERSNPRYSQSKYMMHELKMAVVMYKLDYNIYPSDISLLLPDYLNLGMLESRVKDRQVFVMIRLKSDDSIDVWRLSPLNIIIEQHKNSPDMRFRTFIPGENSSYLLNKSDEIIYKPVDSGR